MKKMRKLIPAISMLLIATIMLSTATFAWFTMNEQVTATGMNIQAQGDASMIISDAPIHVDNTGSNEIKASTNIHTLRAMAYKGTNGTMGTPTGSEKAGWYFPTTNSEANIATGAYDGAYTMVTGTTTGYYVVQEYYIATSGKTFTTDLAITLKAPVHQSTGETYKAFSAAIYLIAKDATEGATKLWDNDKTPTLFGENATIAPNAIIHVDETVVGSKARNTVTIEDVEIPSIAGATEAASVGVKFVVVYYVDGALTSTTDPVRVIDGQKHTSAKGEAFSTDTDYYTFTEKALTKGSVATGYFVKDDADNMVPATGRVDENETYYVRAAAPANLDDDDVIAGDWYVAGDSVYRDVNYCFVRSSDVPGTGSTLELTFAKAN